MLADKATLIIMLNTPHQELLQFQEPEKKNGIHVPSAGDGFICSDVIFICLVRNEWVSNQGGITGDTARLGMPKKTWGHLGSCTE